MCGAFLLSRFLCRVFCNVGFHEALYGRHKGLLKSGVPWLGIVFLEGSTGLEVQSFFGLVSRDGCRLLSSVGFGVCAASKVGSACECWYDIAACSDSNPVKLRERLLLPLPEPDPCTL